VPRFETSAVKPNRRSLTVKDIWDALENEGHGERLEEEMFVFLSAYADAETDARERRLVEAYLREEPDAERQLGFIRSTDAALAADTVEPPAGLREAIFARTTRKPALSWRWAGRMVVASGMAAVVLVVAWVLRSDTPTSSEVASLTPASVSRGSVETALPPPSPPENTAIAPHVGEEVREQPATTGSRKRMAPSEPSHGPAPASDGRASQGESGPGGGSMVLATNPTVGRTPPTPSSFERPIPTLYSGEEPVTVRAEPKPIDPMAMEQPSQEDRRSPGDGGNSAKAEKPPVLPDAREKLREALQKANEERDDLSDSSLNAPRKKLGNVRGVTQ
jgi:hypothetical protein